MLNLAQLPEDPEAVVQLKRMELPPEEKYVGVSDVIA